MLLRRYRRAIKKPVVEETKVDDAIDINDITKAEIIEMLSQKGIEHNPRDKKDILYSLMIEGD